MFFYTNTPIREDKGPISTANWDGTKCYLNHYSNYLFLQFVTNSPRAGWQEKQQARQELTICERKLEYWRKHPNYVHADAVRGIEKLKKDWEIKKAA